MPAKKERVRTKGRCGGSVRAAIALKVWFAYKYGSAFRSHAKGGEGTDICHAIEVVHIAVFPSAVMNAVFGHRNLGPVEYRRLI